MAKKDLDYLKKKYGKLGWSGESYQELVQLIIKHNNKNIGSNMLNVSNHRAKQHFDKIKGSKPKQLIVPNFHDIMTDDLMTKKSAESGKIITNTLRDKLMQDLNDTIREMQSTHQKGRYAGKVNTHMVELFEKKIRDTYESYTKKTGGEVPSNIKTIAITEVMSAQNEMRDAYARTLMQKNNQLQMTKTWIHNAKASKNPRLEHKKLHGLQLPVDQYFRYLNPKTNKTVTMKHPHDSSMGAGIEDIAGCHCSIRYDMTLKKK